MNKKRRIPKLTSFFKVDDSALENGVSLFSTSAQTAHFKFVTHAKFIQFNYIIVKKSCQDVFKKHLSKNFLITVNEWLILVYLTLFSHFFHIFHHF